MPIKPRKRKLEEERYLRSYLEVKINDENLIPGTNQKITKKMILTSTRIGNCSGWNAIFEGMQFCFRVRGQSLIVDEEQLFTMMR